MRRQLKPPLTRPPDFESFWHGTLQELGRVDACLERLAPREDHDPALVMEEISFHGLGQVRIHGYLIRWRDEEPRPLVVHSHGYGSACQPCWSWAGAGLNVVGVDIRGHGRSTGAVTNRSRWGYVLTGMDSPETSVLRGGVCDYIRAIEAARLLLGRQVQRTVLHGASFSGGLALMAEALTHEADLLVVGVPTFGWAEGRHFFVKSGSGAEMNEYLRQRPESTEDLMLVLRYFDPINFAGMVTCPTLVGVGLADDVVPAKTVYAIANHLGGPYEIMEFPVSHSNHPDEQRWQEFEKRWIDLAIRGLPPGFGNGTGGN